MSIEDLVGVQIPVLDKGFVRLVDYMGDDAAIVQAARISYGAGTKQTSEDRHLIRYMLNHKHTSPFEQCEIKLHIRIPMDAWRQMVRHRTACLNEYSTRYSVAIDDKQETDPLKWRLQSTTNKQGSEAEKYVDEAVGSFLSSQEKALHEFAAKVYQERLDAGVAREQARKDLPLSTYTEAYWKIDLKNLLHFIHLRADHHAQLEIRAYANAIASVVEQWVPLAYEAFQDYVVNARTFSAMEMNVLRGLAITHPQIFEVLNDTQALQTAGLSKREITELKEKLAIR